MIRKFKEWVFCRGYKIFARNTFSQAGEDAIINYLLWQAGLMQPTYLELGVYHPWDGSNTFKFYLRGGKGVLVEADPSLIPSIKKARPRDSVLNIGVNFTGEKEADFFIFEEKSISTFNEEEADLRQKQGNKLISRAKVPLKNINDIISENFKKCPDILSIDIEGLDYMVLSQLNEKLNPIPIICAELCSYSKDHIKSKDTRIITLLASKGYSLFADTSINGIFVYDHWFKNIKK